MYFRKNILCYMFLFIGLMSAASGNKPSVTSQDQEQCYCLQEMASGLHAPVGAHFIKDKNDHEMILIVEQRGIIMSLTRGKRKVFLDIRDRVHVSDSMGDSRGLLSAVLSPEFEENGKIYVYYIRQVDRKDYAYISEFTAFGDKVDPSSEKFLLRIYQPFQHGNGGPMIFGDDGFLYIVTGDGGAEDDILGNAQNKNSFHGSILRIDVTKGQTFSTGESGVAKMYSVPQSNPFWNMTNAKEEIYAVGFRNPWGCSVDSRKVGGDGRIYCVDTGTDMFDEVNIIEKGKNYGWNVKEGLSCLKASSCGSIENEALPIFEFQHVSQHALVGGYVYRGSRLGWMKDKGLYTFADILTGETYYLEENKVTETWQVYGWSLCEKDKCPSQARDQPLPHLFAFAQDTKGEIYFLMVNTMNALSPEGRMYRLKAARSSSMQTSSPQLTCIIMGAVSVFMFMTSLIKGL